VEAQHVASTMKIVDDAAEQDLLESLLEASKPPLPDPADGLDYLLASPGLPVWVPTGQGNRPRSIDKVNTRPRIARWTFVFN
jgi:hypothetical protein